MIVQAARIDDRGELIAVIKQAAKVSGLDVDHLERDGAPHEPQENKSPGLELNPDTQIKEWDHTPKSKPAVSYIDDAPQQQFVIAPQVKQTEKPIFKATRCMMWLNPMRYMRIDDPPEDIVPYIGANANTLASKLFWTVLEHTKTECHHMHHPKSRDAFDQNACFRRMIEHTTALRSMSHAFLKAMVEARLEYRQFGYISAEYAGAADLDVGTAMHRDILADYMMRGKDANIWLNPTAVEARIRASLGPAGFGLLEEAVRRPEHDVLHSSVVKAVKKLVENFICFGDGPRWSYQIVDETFAQWLTDASRHSSTSLS